MQRQEGRQKGVNDQPVTTLASQRQGPGNASPRVQQTANASKVANFTSRSSTVCFLKLSGKERRMSMSGNTEVEFHVFPDPHALMTEDYREPAGGPLH